MLRSTEKEVFHQTCQKREQNAHHDSVLPVQHLLQAVKALIHAFKALVDALEALVDAFLQIVKSAG